MDPRKVRANEILAKARGIAAKAESEGRDLNDAEKTEVETLTTELGGIVTALKNKKTNDDALANIFTMTGGIDLAGGTIVPDPDASGGTPLGGPGGKTREPMSAKVAKGIVDFAKSLSNGGAHVSESVRITTPAMSAGSLKSLRRGAKSIQSGSIDTLAGALVYPDQLGLLDATGGLQRSITMLDLVSHATTGTDTVQYSRVTGFTNGATPTPEATGIEPYEAGAGQVSGIKPQSNLTFEKVDATVKEIPTWMPVTKRALSDAGQLRGVIDNFLLYGLDFKLEDEVVNGDGTGEHFDGLLHVSGTQSVSFDTDLITTARKAITAIESTHNDQKVTGFALNPADDERLDLLTDDMGRYYFGGPTASNIPTLWGRPRFTSNAIPAGTMIAGDWHFAQIWDRETASIQATDSHADFFIRNMVAILAELRAAFGVIRPMAFAIVETE